MADEQPQPDNQTSPEPPAGETPAASEARPTGRRSTDGTPAPPAPPAQPEPPAVPSSNDVVGVSDDKVYAAMCYLTVLVFVPLFSKKDDPFINFHVRQGLVILAGLVIAIIASQWINVIGNIFALILLIINIIALIQALQGNKWRAPVIGKIADSFKI